MKPELLSKLRDAFQEVHDAVVSHGLVFYVSPNTSSHTLAPPPESKSAISPDAYYRYVQLVTEFVTFEKFVLDEKSESPTTPPRGDDSGGGLWRILN